MSYRNINSNSFSKCCQKVDRNYIYFEFNFIVLSPFILIDSNIGRKTFSKCFIRKYLDFVVFCTNFVCSSNELNSKQKTRALKTMSQMVSYY